MIYESVESSLSDATKMFDSIVARREKLIKESRDIISLSAKTIVSVHTEDFRQARKLRKQAKRQLEELRKVAGSDLIRYLMTPEQEFVESSVMYSVATQKDIPSLHELGVLPSSYILGLLDAIGELKRLVYDKIRQGDINIAEKMFATMESLYVLISPFAVYDHIAQGVKRKLDVARILIEDTRAIVTEEVRRLEFIASVNKLARKMGSTLLTERPKPSRRAGMTIRPESEGESEQSEPEEEI